MNNADLLQSIRSDIRQAAAQGNQVVRTADLDTYLAAIEERARTEPQALDQVAVENIKTARDHFLANVKRQADAALEEYRSVLAAGDAAIKAAMTINGGGAVALLAFVGHLVSSPSRPGLIAQFALPLSVFVFGVLAAAAAHGLKYITQWFYSHRPTSIGHIFNLLSVAVTTSSLLGFAYATLKLYGIFVRL